MSKRNTVKYRIDSKKPPVLTAAQRKRLKALANKPDSAIDFSDLPKQTARVRWSRPGALIASEKKQQITLRLDADILNFFRKTGERYQSRINAVLREYVKAHS